MRPRFQISGGTPSNNSILSSVQRQGHQDRLKEEYKLTRQLRKGQRHLWDTSEPAQNFIEEEDDNIAGITELGILRSNGQVDKSITGSVVIGDREHKMSEGKVRIISKAAVDDSVRPILEERQFKDAVLSAILADRSGRICRMMLSKERYNMLKPGTAGDGILSIAPNIPREVRNADGRPEFFSYYHESSKEWAESIMRLSIVIDNTPLVYDGDIMDWLSAYGNVKASNPVAS